MKEIMCENHGALQHNGSCSEDEYCAGAHFLEDAVCGKKQLCIKKGDNYFYFKWYFL